MPCFSRIFFSYSLSMIPDWRAALAQALIWLPAGGELHIVDFGGQERLPRWFRAGLRQWLARFHVSPRDELAAELAALAGHAGRLNCRSPRMAATPSTPYFTGAPQDNDRRMAPRP